MKLCHVGAAVALLGATAFSSAGTAMPIANLHTQTVAPIEQVRWVCSPFRCWWRPNYWAPGPYAFYAGRRFYHRPWGWHHQWYRW